MFLIVIYIYMYVIDLLDDCRFVIDFIKYIKLYLLKLLKIIDDEYFLIRIKILIIIKKYIIIYI